MRSGWMIPISILLVSLALLAAMVLSGELGSPVRYEIPAGYRGWIVVQFEQQSCAPLSRDGLYIVVQISTSGSSCTRSPVPRGWRYTRYEYVTADGTRVRLRTGRGGEEPMVLPVSYSPTTSEKRIFVGAKEDFEHFVE